MRSIIIRSAINPEQAPRTIKLFINKPSLGFEDVEDAVEPEAAQVIELTDEQVKEGKPIPLRYVRFQAVTSLHVSWVSLYFLAADSFISPEDFCSYE